MSDSLATLLGLRQPGAAKLPGHANKSGWGLSSRPLRVAGYTIWPTAFRASSGETPLRRRVGVGAE